MKKEKGFIRIGASVNVPEQLEMTTELRDYINGILAGEIAREVMKSDLVNKNSAFTSYNGVKHTAEAILISSSRLSKLLRCEEMLERLRLRDYEADTKLEAVDLNATEVKKP